MAQLLHPTDWSIKIHGNKLRLEYMTHAQWCSIVEMRLIITYIYEEGFELWTYNDKNALMSLKMHTDNKLFCNQFFLKQQLEGDKKRKYRKNKLWHFYYLTLNIVCFATSLTIRYLHLAWSSIDECLDLSQMSFPLLTFQTSLINTFCFH
jgi:hypothetical protein